MKYLLQVLLNLKRLSLKKYSHWIVFVVIFSALPIIINIFTDYVASQKGYEVFSGVHLMDFLICGSCLIGGALCDRYNSKHSPSGLAVGVGVILAFCALGIYSFIKYTNLVQTDGNGRYAQDDILVTVIIYSYVAALVFSLILMRKTLVVDKG